MARSPNIDKAYEMYKDGMKLVEIASQLGVPDGTVRRWKSAYKWDSEQSERSVKNERKKSERSVKHKKHISNTDKKIKESVVESKLNDKQKDFCLYYIRSYNATQSYIKAFNTDWSTANAHAYRMLQKVGIKEEIERLKDIKRSNILANEHDIVELQMRIAFADAGNYISFGKMKTENKYGDPIEVNTVDLIDSVYTDTQLIRKVSEGREGVSIELEDRQKAINWLTKFFLMHPEDKYKTEFDRLKLEHEQGTTNGGVTIVDDIPNGE